MEAVFQCMSKVILNSCPWYTFALHPLCVGRSQLNFDPKTVRGKIVQSVMEFTSGNLPTWPQPWQQICVKLVSAVWTISLPLCQVNSIDYVFIPKALFPKIFKNKRANGGWLSVLLEKKRKKEKRKHRVELSWSLWKWYVKLVIKQAKKRWVGSHLIFPYNSYLDSCSIEIINPLLQRWIKSLRRTAQGEKEVTGLNCSDHSTGSRKLAAWRARVRFHLTQINNPILRNTMMLLLPWSITTKATQKSRENLLK